MYSIGMNKTEELRREITEQSPDAPRVLLVRYLKQLAAEAKALSDLEREIRGNYSALNAKFPQTIGEDIASDISSSLAWQDWINWDDAPDLEYIGSVAGQLERFTDDHALWQELFEKIDKLPD